MRINASQDRFEITFASPDGNYVVRYEPVDDWDGRIAMAIRGVEVGGEVLSVEKGANGERVLMGSTGGFKDLYDDEFWFELRPDSRPPIIEYFGDRVLWRRDEAA
jgi:hypothetical protein